MKDDNMLSRRKFLSLCGALSLSTGLPFSAARAAVNSESRSLKFYNLHTGEKLDVTYFEKGIYQPDAMHEISKVLRDHRTGDVKYMHTVLMDLLYLLRLEVDSEQAFHVISGYRSPKTNQMLFEKTNGVRVDSLHMQGRAIDIRIPGIKLPDLRQAALNMQSGGVGYYQKSNFIHIDTGPTESWE